MSVKLSALHSAGGLIVTLSIGVACQGEIVNTYEDGEVPIAVCDGDPRPGPHPRMSRLSHEQYDNSVRDLLSLDVRPSQQFLVDTEQAGFNNNAASRLATPRFAYLLGKLKGYQGENGTLLDDSSVLWINELSNGRQHNFMDLPIVTAGSSCGYMKTGQYVRLSQGGNTEAPHNKLLTTILNGLGVPETHFGNPNFGKPGEYTEIKA